MTTTPYAEEIEDPKIIQLKLDEQEIAPRCRLKQSATGRFFAFWPISALDFVIR